MLVRDLLKQVLLLCVTFCLEPPHIADINDVLVDINEQDNVTLNCSFTGNPRPTVFWMRVLNKRKFPVLQYFNDSTVINGTTAILHLLNTAKHLGSYQCIAVNEAGYVSRTARVLPKGKCKCYYILIKHSLYPVQKDVYSVSHKHYQICQRGFICTQSQCTNFTTMTSTK